MKTILLALLATTLTFAADEVADRAAVEKTVQAMNAFTADFDGKAELVKLSSAAPSVEGEAKPTVVISSEPMGEATILMPGMTMKMTPVIVVKKVRFVTPDVAIVDAAAKSPMLVVVKREGTDWKIASLRMLAEK